MDSYTKLLLRLDNNVLDSSPTPKTVTNNGVTFSNTIKKFGYSGVFNGTSAYLSVPDNTDWNLWSADTTVDFWANFSSLTGNHFFCGQRVSGWEKEIVWRSAPSQLQLSIYEGGSYRAWFSCSFTPVVDTWYHIAVVRSGTTCKMFINGVSQTVTVQTPFGTISDHPTPFYLGKEIQDGFYFKGRMDEFRVSKGIARWTENFDVPIGPYTGIVSIYYNPNADTIADSKAVVADSKAVSAGTAASTAKLDAETHDLAAISIADSKAVKAILDASTADAKAVTADSKAVVADSKAVAASSEAAVADSKAVVADSKAVIADSKAVLADSKAVLADSIADAAKAAVDSAIGSEPAAGEYKVTDINLDTDGSIIVKYDDISI